MEREVKPRTQTLATELDQAGVISVAAIWSESPGLTISRHERLWGCKIIGKLFKQKVMA